MNFPANCKYTMLMASLPAHKNNLFDEELVPLSRIQLNKRLALLDDKDSADLQKIESLLHWSHMKADIDQAFVEKTLQSIESIDSEFIKNIVIWRLEFRFILAALRMRNKGIKQGSDSKFLDFDFWHFFISNYWHEPDFGLSKQLPWLMEANTLLLENKSYQLEKLLFSVVWEHYHRQNFGHYFNFEAVIIYVLRWDIVSRWSKNDSTLALKRFDDLVNMGLENLDL